MDLAYGVFDDGRGPRVGARRGHHVLDVGKLASEAGLDEAGALAAPSLNPFMALGRTSWRRVSAWLADTAPEGSIPLEDVQLRLPFEVADYVDFFSSEHHATNVGRLFRPGADPLPANWRHLPAGYHGRSGTVVVSGTPIVRPSGQRITPGDTTPSFGPSLRLDIEAEVGFVVGAGSQPGAPIPLDRFRDHVFGISLVNDWSARDIQAWEYVPLGPFLGKSFATSISPWVVPLDALDAAWIDPPAQDPPPLPYLARGENHGLDLDLEIDWNGTVVSRPPFATMYWTPAQQLAHLTSGGAHVRTGDLFASGTVSGPNADQRGSFLELSWDGQDPIELADGSSRTFVEDGDTITIRGTARGSGGTRLDLGAVTGRVDAGWGG